MADALRGRPAFLAFTLTLLRRAGPFVASTLAFALAAAFGGTAIGTFPPGTFSAVGPLPFTLGSLAVALAGLLTRRCDCSFAFAFALRGALDT